MEVAADIKQDPVGLLGTKASVFSVSCLEEIGFIQPPGPSLSPSGRIQAAVNQGRERMQSQGETVKSSLEARSCFSISGYTQPL